MVGVEKDPHRSQWMSLKGNLETWILEANGNVFCLEKWHTSQHCVLLICTSGTTLFNKLNLAWEGWPSLKCHKLELLQDCESKEVAKTEWCLAEKVCCCNK